jgi:hypothetical protein
MATPVPCILEALVPALAFMPTRLSRRRVHPGPPPGHVRPPAPRLHRVGDAAAPVRPSELAARLAEGKPGRGEVRHRDHGNDGGGRPHRRGDRAI